MKNHCKANPCCGAIPCEGVPLPQHRSGLWFHNSEEYRRKAGQLDAPSPSPKAEGTPPTPAEYVQDALENDGILYGPGAGRPLGLLAQSMSKRDRQRLQSAFKKGVKEGRRLEREAHAAEIEKISMTLSAKKTEGR